MSVDSNAHSLTLSIDIKYDHMESNHVLEDILGVLTMGALFHLTDWSNNYVESVFLNGIATTTKGWAKSNIFLLGPFKLSESSPSTGEFVFSGTYNFTLSTWNGLVASLMDLYLILGETGTRLTLSGNPGFYAAALPKRRMEAY